ncbi:hypothetical protein PZB75_05420 [Streptomyces sp. AM 4-1-1]|uniref:hypothetical protein n=1 Tax=unclassified Streptomyces TaxID=2593676 RepID=UPI0023B8C3AE|nr:hypothetical protein [Streptomyces sp. AM 4-1-1]WEH32869.1 hypothetical protein PZB75_05420 [Streptomyces sp. AM 4-1-1]
MSVTDRRHRRLGIAAGSTLLTLALAGCSGLGRNAVGPIIYKTDQDKVIQVDSPSVRGCHRLDPGATEVTNGTLVDVILYTTPDCSGRGVAYVATTLTDNNAHNDPLWRSYTIVH